MRNLVKVATTLTLAMFVAGCSGSSSPSPKAKDSGISLKGKTVYIKSSSVNYSAKSRVAENIKNECKLNTKLITFIQEGAKNRDMTVKITENIPAGGTELKVEITDSVSQGNSFIGHRKFTSIAGSLVQAGKTIGTFEAARRSGGGMFAGFKGSCAVLGRTVKTLGEDVAKWMLKPSTGAALGDTRLIPRNQ